MQMAQQNPFSFTNPPTQQQPPSSFTATGEGIVFSSDIGTAALSASTNNNNETLVTGGVKLGSMLFKTADSLFNYLHNALMNTRLGQDVRYDECIILLELLKKGHEKVNDKIGCGISSIKVEYHPGFKKSKCFMLYRKDGSKEDFSYIKCVCKVFNVEPKPFGGFKRRNNHFNGNNKKVREDGSEYELNEDEEEQLEDEKGLENSKTFDPFSDNAGTSFGIY